MIMINWHYGFRKRNCRTNKLKEFFHSEILAEAQSGFARLARIPSLHVVDKLRYYSKKCS